MIRAWLGLLSILLTIGLANSTSALAHGGDLPFPLGHVVPLKSAEHWRTSALPILFETQFVRINGQKGTLIRASSDEGFVLDQAFVPLAPGPVETNLVLEAGLTVRFSHTRSHHISHAFITDMNGRQIILERHR